MTRFIGRTAELNKLSALAQKKTASFVIVRGRRRIGKSRLVAEFSKHFDHFYHFEGIAPVANMSAEDQLNEFSRQIAREFKTAYAPYEDWSDALWAVGERVQKGKILLSFDEISWMGRNTPTFLSKIKSFWDNHLKKNDKLMFIVCGSVSAWIEKNILSSTGFVGRISYTLTLEELPLTDCDAFWPKNIAAFEKLKILAVTGGIPKYLEEIDTKIPAEDNIRSLCFNRGGMLVEEFKQIFSDLFLRNSSLYQKIIETLVGGAKTRSEISHLLNIESGSRLSEYLKELELAGFITRDYSWNIRSGRDSKLCQYRLHDNYFRFYLKYIFPNISKIDRNNFQFKSLTALPEWQAIIGLQFENLVLKNRALIYEALHLSPHDIISENPFYQRKTTDHPGCQIDYLIQTKFNTLYVCEIKFIKNLVDSTVIHDVQHKINAIKTPKGYSFRPVLIHVNGVTEDVAESDFFAAIINFSHFLHPAGTKTQPEQN